MNKILKNILLLTAVSTIFISCSSKTENSVVTSENIKSVEVFIQALGLNVRRVAFNSNDSRMITSGGKGTTVWDMNSKREIKTFFNYEAHSMVISKSGRILITYSPAEEGAIKIYDLEKMKVDSLQTLSEGQTPEYIGGIAVSDDDKFFAIDQNKIKIFDTGTLKLKTEIEFKKDHNIFNYRKKGMRFMPDSDDLLTLSYKSDGTSAEPDVVTEMGDLNIDQIDSYSIDIWNIETKQPKFSYNFRSNYIYSWTLSKDGTKIALLTIDNHLKIIDITTSSETNHKIQADGEISDLAFREDGRLTIAGGDGFIGNFSLATDSIERIETDVVSYFRSGRCFTALSNDGNMVVFHSSSADRIILHDLKSGITSVLQDEAESPASVFYDADSQLNIFTDKKGFKLNGSSLDSKDLNINNRGCFSDQIRIEYEETGVTEVLDTKLNKTIFSGILGKVNTYGDHYIYFSQNGNYAFSNLRDNEDSPFYLRVVNLYDKNSAPVKLENSDGYGLGIRTFDNDTKAIVSGYAHLNLGVWDIQTGELLYQLEEQSGNSEAFEFIEGSKCLVSARGLVKLYDLEDRKIIKTFLPKGYEGRYKEINKIALSENKKFFLTGDTDGLITLWDIEKENEILSFKRHKDAVTSIAFSPDGKYIISSSSYDKSVALSDLETGKEIARFVTFSDGEWIVMTPEGYFNASPNGAKYINVRIGNQVYSIDNFYEKYYNPAYVASVLQGKDVRPVADIRDGVALPPEVRIVSPETNTEVKSEEVTITISAKDMGGGIDEIRLYHNGKAVGEDTRGVKIVPKVDISTKDYTITLVDGTNNFRAVGYSRDRTESNPSEIIINLLAPEKDISLFVLSVGINEYKNPALNLNYAEPDAKAIADFFRRSGDDLFKTSEIREIYNGQATKTKILSLLKELESSSPQDVVLIYLAGHGENINEKWYFIPHELTYPEREEDVIAKAISSDELSNSIKNIKAQKILVLIDACKSGAALLAFRGFEDRKALSQLSRATGVHVVAASSKDQFAAEVKDLGHGVFTYTLLDGLNGKAASKGENVTVRKLMLYIDEQLPELTKKYRQEAQYPVVDSKGMDFPLVKGR
ncbi:MAG: caspase family protein [Candidatus Delongbacteria bacterium]|jgi:WD40 repeat protein|nr:caspase family protein [Candidatus Delongbacteria bacterium]